MQHLYVQLSDKHAWKSHKNIASKTRYVTDSEKTGFYVTLVVLLIQKYDVSQSKKSIPL